MLPLINYPDSDDGNDEEEEPKAVVAWFGLRNVPLMSNFIYRFSLFSREIKLCYKLHTIFLTARHMVCEFSQNKMTKKVPVLIGSLICCCLLDKVYAIDHSFVEGLDTNLHKIHRSLLQDDTGKLTCSDFTYFFKQLSNKFTLFPFPVTCT